MSSQSTHSKKPEATTASRTQQLIAEDKRYLWHPFTPMRLWLQDDPLVIDRGKGCHLYDTDGNAYLDGNSSLWCNIHGHGHPHILQAIQQQSAQIAHSTLLGLASPPSIQLAKQLVAMTPAGLEKVFYSDSGATSVEIAIKIAFQYWRNIGQPRRGRFLALRNAYHGDTMGSVSVGGIDVFHSIFGPLTFQAIYGQTPNPYRFDGSAEQCRDHALRSVREQLEQYGSEIAAIVTEPLVQGAAGIVVHPPGFLKGLRELADEFGVLLIADEVAVGFGRTGTMFACEQEGVSPDILCLAKGITAGTLPLAATLTTLPIFNAFLADPWWETTFFHGHTYTGNAIACAAAIANLEVFEQENTLANLQPTITRLSEHLARIARLDHVGHTRQCGMMAGIELVADKATARAFSPEHRVGAYICRLMRDKGVILRPLGDVIVVNPPLAISLEEIDELMGIVFEAINQAHDFCVEAAMSGS